METFIISTAWKKRTVYVVYDFQRMENQTVHLGIQFGKIQ